MKVKKYLSLLLAVVMIASVFSTTAFASESELPVNEVIIGGDSLEYRAPNPPTLFYNLGGSGQYTATLIDLAANRGSYTKYYFATSTGEIYLKFDLERSGTTTNKNRELIIYVSNINLAFRKGTLYGLCGKNGSGKTTLMLLLLGIYPNYRGEILINGINQKQYNLKKLRSCVIHYTEQTPVFFDEPMVKNFELFEGERRPFLQVKTYIQMLGLHNIVSLEDDALRFSEHYQYSAGELAKIAILRSLVLKKSVYIWDEPDTALDEAAKQALIKILKELSNEAIVVIITHNSDLLNACETIYHL